MPKYRVVLKRRATVYASYDVTANDRDHLDRMLQSQRAIDDLVTSRGADQEVSEVDEDGNWLVDEIGPEVAAMTGGCSTCRES